MREKLSLTDIDELSGMARHAISFDFYVFRKAYGSYYATWVTAILLFVFLPFLIFSEFPSDYSQYVFLVLYTTILIFAFRTTTIVFSNAREMIGLRSILEGKKSYPSKGRLISYLPSILFVIIIIVLSFEGLKNILAILIFYGFLILMSYYLLQNLKSTFEQVPLEGIVSVSSYIFSIILSIAAILLFNSQMAFSLAWLPAIIGWYFSAVYAILKSKKHLEGINVQT
jgi:hypothetical protein